MVTTAILWAAGIGLIAVASSGQRFDRALDAASRSPAAGAGTSRRRGPHHPLVKSSRLLTLVIGGMCLVLAGLGTWSHFR